MNEFFKIIKIFPHSRSSAFTLDTSPIHSSIRDESWGSLEQRMKKYLLQFKQIAETRKKIRRTIPRSARFREIYKIAITNVYGARFSATNIHRVPSMRLYMTSHIYILNATQTKSQPYIGRRDSGDFLPTRDIYPCDSPQAIPARSKQKTNYSDAAAWNGNRFSPSLFCARGFADPYISIASSLRLRDAWTRALRRRGVSSSDFAGTWMSVSMRRPLNRTRDRFRKNVSDLRTERDQRSLARTPRRTDKITFIYLRRIFVNNCQARFARCASAQRATFRIIAAREIRYFRNFFHYSSFVARFSTKSPSPARRETVEVIKQSRERFLRKEYVR